MAAGAAVAFGRGGASRGRRLALFLLLQVVCVLAGGLAFAAASPKHLIILLPAWVGLIALGLASFRRRWLALLLGALILATTMVSLFNYATGRQFTDADMVTPWRAIASRVADLESPSDAVFIGGKGDHHTWDMFRRYYNGKVPVQRLDFGDWRRQLSEAFANRQGVWLLFYQADPGPEIMAWCRQEGATLDITAVYQMEEHTLAGLQAEGLYGSLDLRSALWVLYRFEAPPK